MWIVLLAFVVAGQAQSAFSSNQGVSLGACPAFTGAGSVAAGGLAPFVGALVPGTEYCLEWDWIVSAVPTNAAYTLGPLGNTGDTATQKAYLDINTIETVGSQALNCPVVGSVTGGPGTGCNYINTFNPGTLTDFTAFRYDYIPAPVCLGWTNLKISMDTAFSGDFLTTSDILKFNVAPSCTNLAAATAGGDAQQAPTAGAETPGSFVVTITATTSPTTICYHQSGGSAVAGIDYVAFPVCAVFTCECAVGNALTCACCGATDSCVTIPATQMTANIPVTPIFAAIPGHPASTLQIALESSTTETAGATLFVTSAYDVGITAATPTINILSYPIASVPTTINGVQSASAPVDGQFTFSISAPVLTATEVCYTVGGTAVPGSDYTAIPVNTCGGTCAAGQSCVVIAAGLTSATEAVQIPAGAGGHGGGPLTVTASITKVNNALIGFSAPTETNTVSITTFTSASGDPHINGPNGNQVEFRGQGGASYMLFESQQFAVTMRMAEYGPSVHYITAIGLRFQGAALYFDTHPRSLGVVAHMNQSLKPYNASVVHPAGNRNMFQLNMCPGVAILIVQKVTKINGKRVGFLNIEFDIPGCHDDFSGVLGQMYQCKWEKETFVWDPATEESFKVPRLLPPTKNALCLLSHHFGKPYSGPKGGAASHEQISP